MTAECCDSLKNLVIAAGNDRGMVLKAICQDGNLLQYVSEELRSDPKLVALACEMSGGRALEHASEAVKRNLRLVVEMVNGETGILHSLDTTDDDSLRNFLEQRLGLHRELFLEVLHLSITAPAIDEHIPTPIMQQIAQYIGIPLGSELQQLRLSREMLPIFTSYGEQYYGNWATLVDRADQHDI